MSAIVQEVPVLDFVSATDLKLRDAKDLFCLPLIGRNVPLQYLVYLQEF